MPSDQKTDTPRVPLQTPMFDGDMTAVGKLTRTWIIFFERKFKNSNTVGAPPGPFIRTLLLKNTTVGNDIADHVPIYRPGTAGRVIAVLRKAITSDLIVRVNYKEGNPAAFPLCTIKIPLATPIDTPITRDVFANKPQLLADLGVLSFDVTASDGSIDAAGVASFTVQWF